METGHCEQCGVEEPLYECDSCAHALCETCYGDILLPTCFDCLSEVEDDDLLADKQPEGAERDRGSSAPRKRTRRRGK